MNLEKWTGEFRKAFGGAVNLALIPVRLPGDVTYFAWRTISHWWSERRRRKHGRVLDVERVTNDPMLPNGQQY